MNKRESEGVQEGEGEGEGRRIWLRNKRKVKR